MILRIMSALTLFLSTALWVQSVEAAAYPADGELDFVVFRDGEEIGSHVLKFKADNSGTVEVDIETDIAVSMMFVTVYRFEHEGHERWENGQLVSLISETDDDGEAHDLVVRADGAVLEVSDNGVTVERPFGLLTGSLWHSGIVGAPATTLLNTLNGNAMNITVQDVGDEQVQGEQGLVAARHYRLTGDLEREVWYDTDGVLVQIRFSADDGSEILYVLQ